MIEINEKFLSVQEVEDILFNNKVISVNQYYQKKVKNSFEFLKKFLKDKILYGINTGLGPMTQYKVSDKDQIDLQYNLIRSHCSGAGQRISNIDVKASMIARLVSLIQGHSGIHFEVIALLVELINRDVYPYIPEHGGVGASGDLVQLSHLALVLIGEGEVFYKNELLPTKTVFGKLGLNPVSIHIREGLALINGTSVMTGIGLVNLIRAKNLVNWMVVASAMMNEIVESFDDSFSKELNCVKKHFGQNLIADLIQNLLADSKLIKKRQEHLYDKKLDVKVFEEKVQEYYSIRCIPQIIGPIYDTLNYSEKIICDELNSVNDNPIIDEKNDNVFHGGNFHGDYISFEMDKIKIAITKLSILSERQLNYLLNDKLNNKLPPFINLGTLGLNLGMQGVQFTATSTTAENQTLSNPMYVHNIPNNNDNQDVVSMGTNSALLAKKVIENTYQVMSIEFMAILQAVDYLGCLEKMSSYTKNVYKKLRQICPVFVKDSIKYKDIENIKKFFIENRLDLVLLNENMDLCKL